MSIISYAQNFEDVMLWRALKHIQKGFYIDVGAWSPDQDSVTKLFYAHGWRGINIEPNPRFHAQLEEKRPHDINLRTAISNAPGIEEMNFFNNAGLSTLDSAIAEQHCNTGLNINKQLVDVSTLAGIWSRHVPAKQGVHFLKVDVEGLEEAVLRGNDWEHYRPWIAVVEATVPMSQKESYHQWESTLISADYQFAYADGLNRFYVAREHSELLPTFKYPPNFFDGFLLDRQKQAEKRAQHAEEQVRQTADNLQNLYNSTSWKVTAPLRWIVQAPENLNKTEFFARIKAFVKMMACPVIWQDTALKDAKPGLRNQFTSLAERLGLYTSLLTGHPQLMLPKQDQATKALPDTVKRLSPSARRIVTDLTAALLRIRNRGE